MVIMFIDTLPSPYYDKVVGNVASNFTDLVVFAQSSNNIGFAKKPSQEKRKCEANAVLVESVLPRGRGKPPSPYPTQIHLKGSRSAAAYMNLPPHGDVGVTTSSNTTRPAWQNLRRNIPRMLDPILMSYMELLVLLLQQKLLAMVPLRPIQPPYPKSYDPNTNVTSMVWSLDIIEEGWLSFKEHGPNVKNNLLPTRRGPTGEDQ
ncbi:hypothetical protein CR513_40935, partial [Mucuna pruriens]